MISVSEKVSFLQRVFGTCLLGNDGINVAVCCPNPKCGSHGKPSKKKLVIRIDNDRFHCWVCDIKGRSLTPLIRRHFPSHLHEYHEKFAVKKPKLKFLNKFYRILVTFGDVLGITTLKDLEGFSK